MTNIKAQQNTLSLTQLSTARTSVVNNNVETDTGTELMTLALDSLPMICGGESGYWEACKAGGKVGFAAGAPIGAALGVAASGHLPPQLTVPVGSAVVGAAGAVLGCGARMGWKLATE
jgi:hypothetical protein